MNEMQQAFERWAKSKYYFMKKTDGIYHSPITASAWDSWQAVCRWADGAEQVDRSVAIPEGCETNEGGSKC